MVKLLSLTQWALVGVLAMAHVYLHVLAASDTQERSVPGFLLATLPFSQGALLLFLGLQGPGRWYLRFPLTAAGLAAIFLLSPTMDSDIERWTFLFQLLFIGVLLALFALLGITVRSGGERVGRIRFSLRGLLALMVAVALTVGLAQAVRAAFPASEDVPLLWGAASVGATFASVFLLACWAFLGGRRWIWRAVLFALFAPLAGLVPPYIWQREYDLPWIVLWLSVHAAVVGISLVVFRLCGLRWGVRLGYLPPPSTNRPPENQADETAPEAVSSSS